MEKPLKKAPAFFNDFTGVYLPIYFGEGKKLVTLCKSVT